MEMLPRSTTKCGPQFPVPEENHFTVTKYTANKNVDTFAMQCKKIP